MVRKIIDEAGALVKPKGIRVNRMDPTCNMNAVLSLSSSTIGICQYPEIQSRVENALAPRKESMQSSIRGMGYESRMVLAFSFRYYTQKRGVPSGFGTCTTGPIPTKPV